VQARLVSIPCMQLFILVATKIIIKWYYQISGAEFKKLTKIGIRNDIPIHFV